MSQKTKTTFAKAAEGQKESFKLPNKSYIDACYNKHFSITKEWPEYLTKRFDGAEGSRGKNLQRKDLKQYDKKTYYGITNNFRIQT